MSCHRKEEGERVSGHTRKLDLVLDGPAIVVLAGRRTQIAPHAGGPTIGAVAAKCVT